MKITDNLVKSSSAKDSLLKIQNLDLSGRGIDGTIEDAVLKQLKNLNVLDLSQNSITEFSPSLVLPKLEILDCSDNQLTSLQFIENFTNCKQLYLDGNDEIKLSDKVKLFRMHDTVDVIDDIKRSAVDNFKKKWDVMVHSKWEVLFAARYADGLNGETFDTVLEEFYLSLISDALFKSIHSETEKAFLKDLAAELVEKAQNKTLFDDSGTTKGTPRSARLNHKWFNREGGPSSNPTSPMETEHGTSNNRVIPLSRPSGKRRRESTPDLHSEQPSKRARNTTPSTPTRHPDTFTSLKVKPCLSHLPPVGDFDPIFFIRCHSADNDPTDEKTKVWKCAFEPSINNVSSKMLATCGGQNVCLIDCQTGKVMKRYKDNSKTEDFYTLAWSTITYKLNNKEEKTNILAVAGNNGYIKLIHPSQFVMYATMEGHHDYISCLLFHPTKPTYLFSGSKDKKIILWDVGIPDFTDYTTKYKKLQTLNTIQTDALNLVYSIKCDMLVAGCENSCFGWKMNTISKTSREPDVEFIIPSTRADKRSNDTETVDGLSLLPNGFIASKCSGADHLIIWNLKDNLPVKYIKGTKSVKVKTSSILQYTETSVDYIGLGSHNGILTAGDDKGSVYVYNTDVLTKLPKLHADQEMIPSLKLDWQELDFKFKKGKESTENEDIVINNCCPSEDHQFMACGTDNNLVCIWKKTGNC